MNMAAVIINYNTREDLRRCLRSLSVAGAEETLVVDNGSSDGSQEMVRSEFPGVRLLDNPGNKGYSSACNCGVRATDTDLIFILNSDTEFPDHLGKLVEHMEAHPELGALGPKILNGDGSIQMSCRKFPTVAGSLFHGLLGDWLPDNPFTRKYHMKDFDHRAACEVDWVSGAAMLLRREALEKTGLFDEGYFMYVEDVDLCYRLWRADWHVGYCPQVRVMHYIGRTSRQQSARMLLEHHRSMYRYFIKTHSGLRGWVLRPFVLAGLVLRFALCLIRARLRSGNWSAERSVRRKHKTR